MLACLRLVLLHPLLALLPTAFAAAQPTAPPAGRLRYEATRRIDLDRTKITVVQDGQPVDMSSEDLKNMMPETTSFSKTLVFNGSYAREEREHAGLKLATGGAAMSGAVPGRAMAQSSVRVSSIDRPYLNLTDRTVTTVTTVAGTDYVAAARPVPPPPAGWQELPQTRTIAGFQCHRVTVPFKKETYTLWVTTELPFAYSPVRELTPTRGVVLALSSDQEEYTATRLTAEAVAEADVRPSPQAKPVTEAELKELRTRAQADMQQRLLEQYSGAGQR